MKFYPTDVESSGGIDLPVNPYDFDTDTETLNFAEVLLCRTIQDHPERSLIRSVCEERKLPIHCTQRQ
jgi:hypothetical protein